MNLSSGIWIISVCVEGEGDPWLHCQQFSQEVPTAPGATARSADATTSLWLNTMADRNVPRPAQGGTEQSHWATLTGSVINCRPTTCLKTGCCHRRPSREVVVCGTGSARSALTGTSQKWSEEEERTQRMLSKQVDWNNKSRVDWGRIQPLSDFNGGLRGQLFRQNEIRGASFVPHHSGVEKTVPSVWGKVRFMLYLD